jgi:cell division protein FtsL
MKNKQYLWIIIVVISVIITAIAIFLFLQQRSQISDLQQQSELVKERLDDEYNDLIIDYEGYRMRISNDSIIAKLETEQMKVQRLQEELRTVKSTNTKRINELTKELETLRAIARNYVIIIDSLNRVNEKLSTENRQVNARLKQSTQTVSQLTKEKEQLTETVQKASQLTTSNITVVGLNDKNRAADQIKNMKNIEVRFVINKNITAQPGEKTIYIRIMRPNDEVLIESRSNVFTYENREIEYSSKRTIEYEGEDYPVTIYWDVQQSLFPGTYRVDIFADGHRIGQKSVRWDK